MAGGRAGNGKQEQARLNSLNLSQKKLDQVLDLLDKQSGAGPEVARTDARWPFRQASVPVRIEHPGGSAVDVRMACRNLSRTGVGLLHSAFIYNGTKCIVSLPHPTNGDTQAAGEVVRCQHRGGVLHEIGVRFEREINLRCFVRPDPIRELFSVERIDPSTVVGTVLHLEPNGLDAQVMKHFLRDTQVRLRTIDDLEQAVEIARAGVDLIVSEFRIGDSTGEDLTLRLRAENVSTPIILCSADRGPHVMELVDGRSAQAFLGKPVAQEKLIQALAEFLTGESHPAANCGAPADRALIQAVKPELIRCAKAIEDAVQRNQPMDVLGTCMQLQSTAPTIGMADLSFDLDAVVGQLSESMNLAEVTDEIAQIIKRCRAA